MCWKKKTLQITEPSGMKKKPAASGDAPAAVQDADADQSITNGSTITFHDVNYSVQVKNPNRRCGKTSKDILTHVSGIFKPGMNAILGPTGSGKSSLLDILAGRKDPAGLSGHVLVGGHRQPKNFKCMSGYVVQDDMVLGTLTVRENLMFSANVRLPESIPHNEKERRVEDTIYELGLESCAETKVGTEFIRGISGGERKRTNIGMELIISPSVLFLDEPTTGLDAYTALAIIQLLHSLSRRGRTVIFSIHQPRYAIYRMFDRLTILVQGQTAYNGPAQEALEFFESLGYKCEAFNNPPDFFLDVIQGEHETDESCYKGVTDTVLDHLGPTRDTNLAEVVDELTIKPTMMSLECKEVLYNKFASTYSQSKWHTDLKGEIDPILKEHEMNKSANVEEPPYATSAFTQLRHLSKRFLTNLFRNPLASLMQWVMTTGIALMVGVIYFDVDKTYPNGVQNRSGAIFFLTMNVVFNNVNAMEVFVKERALFIHENVSGFYQVSSYFLGKVLCDIVPLRAIPTTAYCTITYFMIGFDADVSKFFFYLMQVMMVSFTSTSLAFMLSAYCRLAPIGIMFMAGLFVLMMVFGGVFFNVNNITPVLRWMQYLSIFRYTMKALCINEMKDMMFCDAKNGTCSEAGNTYMEEQSIKYDTTWDLWQNPLALVIMMTCSLILTYIQLRRMPKLK